MSNEETAGKTGTADPPLQPLRIPDGWTVRHNDFREVDPSLEGVEEDFLLREDLLCLELSDSVRPRAVDLGWYGSFAEGTFGVMCVDWADDPTHWMRLVEGVRTRDRQVAVAAVERMLVQYYLPRSTRECDE